VVTWLPRALESSKAQVSVPFFLDFSLVTDLC
jgi:hypothetical protein